jgi:hypothetical protein
MVSQSPTASSPSPPPLRAPECCSLSFWKPARVKRTPSCGIAPAAGGGKSAAHSDHLAPHDAQHKQMGRSNLDQTSQALLCWRTEPPRILPAPAVHAVAVRLPASEPGPASRITLGGAPNLERLDDLAHPTSGTAGHPLAARAAPGGRPHFCRSVTYWSYSMADTGCMYRRIGPSSKNFDQGSPGAAHAPPPRPQCGVRQRGSTRVQRPPAARAHARGRLARACPYGCRNRRCARLGKIAEF